MSQARSWRRVATWSRRCRLGSRPHDRRPTRQSLVPISPRPVETFFVPRRSRLLDARIDRMLRVWRRVIVFVMAMSSIAIADTRVVVVESDALALPALGARIALHGGA